MPLTASDAEEAEDQEVEAAGVRFLLLLAVDSAEEAPKGEEHKPVPPPLLFLLEVRSLHPTDLTFQTQGRYGPVLTQSRARPPRKEHVFPQRPPGQAGTSAEPPRRSDP